MADFSNDYRRLGLHLVYLFLISSVLGILVSYKVDNVSMSALIFSTIVLALLLYPVLFLQSWVKNPPTSLFVRAFVHLITLPSIIYYLLVSLCVVQYLAAAFSWDALCLTIFIAGIAWYLIHMYRKFLKEC